MSKSNEDGREPASDMQGFLADGVRRAKQARLEAEPHTATVASVVSPLRLPAR